jgi:hypothetical protein
LNSKQLSKINMKKLATYLIGLAVVGVTACQVPDPFVDRVVAPVLLVFDNALGDGGGFTTEPTVTSKANVSSATLSVRILELDKTNILDNKKGIDSVAVSGAALSLTTRAGVKIADVTTDAKGRATFTAAWTAFGVATPRVGAVTSLTLSGTHKGQAFSKLVRLQGN